MWREEVGITEMLLAYIGEFTEFRGWSSWRMVVIDILTCHEEARRRRYGYKSSDEYFTYKAEAKGNLPTLLSEVENEMCPSNRDCVQYVKGDGSGRVIDLTCEEPTNSLLFNDVKTEEYSEEYCITENSIGGKEIDNSLDCQEDLIAKQLHQNDVLGINQADVLKHFESCDNLTKGENLRKGNTSATVKCNHQTLYRPIHFNTLATSTESTNSSRVGTSVPQGLMDVPADRTYSSSDDLKVQNQSSIPTVCKFHKCRFCNERFSNSFQLKQHTRSHTNENSKQCSFCSKVFFSPSHRKSHERIHTGEKPFACNYCPKRFNQNSIRKTHEITHTGEKPYACSYCGQRFKCRSSRLKHQRTHNTDIHFSKRCR